MKASSPNGVYLQFGQIRNSVFSLFNTFAVEIHESRARPKRTKRIKPQRRTTTNAFPTVVVLLIIHATTVEAFPADLGKRNVEKLT